MQAAEAIKKLLFSRGISAPSCAPSKHMPVRTMCASHTSALNNDAAAAAAAGAHERAEPQQLLQWIVPRTAGQGL